MEYSGIVVIDDQHETLMQAIRKLRAACTMGQDAELSVLLKEVQQQTIVHFAAEEQMMRGSDYFDYTNHIAVHSDFTEIINETVDQFEKTGIMNEKSLVFFESWLQHHINVEAQLFELCIEVDLMRK